MSINMPRRTAIVQIYDSVNDCKYYRVIYDIQRKTMKKCMNIMYIEAHDEFAQIESLPDDWDQKQLYKSMLTHSRRHYEMTIKREYPDGKHPENVHDRITKFIVQESVRRKNKVL